MRSLTGAINEALNGRRSFNEGKVKFDEPFDLTKGDFLNGLQSLKVDATAVAAALKDIEDDDNVIDSEGDLVSAIGRAAKTASGKVKKALLAYSNDDIDFEELIDELNNA